MQHWAIVQGLLLKMPLIADWYLYCVCLISQSVIEDKKYGSITNLSGGKY